MAVTTEWYRESSLSDVRTPSGRSQSAGAVRRCEVRRLRLWGLPSVVRSEDAVPSSLKLLVMAKHAGLESHTEACLAGLCMSAMSAEAWIRGGRPAS
jgi:hypothetical protein